MNFKYNTKQRTKSVQGLRSFKDTLPQEAKRILNKKGQIYSNTLDNWKKDSFRLSIKVGADDFTEEQLLPCMDYDEWRNIYQYGTMRTTQSRPTVVAVHPSKAIGFGPIPDKTYRFIGEFYRKPVEFVSDDDQPSFSDRYHMAIVYKAMMYYGGFESAPEVFSRGEYEFRRIMERLHAEELPTTMSGPPLA